MARYVIRASNEAGPIEFSQRLTIEAALAKARELRDAHFHHISLINTASGLVITDLDALIPEQEGDA